MGENTSPSAAAAAAAAAGSKTPDVPAPLLSQYLTDVLTHGAVHALNNGTHGRPFEVLGPHKFKNRRWITTLQPGAVDVAARVGQKDTPLARLHGDVFCGPVPGKAYKLVVTYADGTEVVTRDPYAFAPVLGDLDLHLMGEGTHQQLWRALGAHVMKHDGVQGTHFAVWAPNAQRVSVVGDFNHWDGRRHVMRARGNSGVWEMFLPELGEGTLYKFEVLGADGVLVQKADPIGYGSQHPPEQASVGARHLRLWLARWKMDGGAAKAR